MGLETHATIRPAGQGPPSAVAMYNCGSELARDFARPESRASSLPQAIHRVLHMCALKTRAEAPRYSHDAGTAKAKTAVRLSAACRG